MCKGSALYDAGSCCLLALRNRLATQFLNQDDKRGIPDASYDAGSASYDAGSASYGAGSTSCDAGSALYDAGSCCLLALRNKLATQFLFQDDNIGTPGVHKGRPMVPGIIDNSYGILSGSVTLIANSQHVHTATLRESVSRPNLSRKLILSGGR